MRKTQVVTTSIPPKMMREAERLARQQQMTRSELFREALRQYIRDARIERAVEVAEKERREGKLKALPPGGLVGLMGQ